MYIGGVRYAGSGHHLKALAQTNPKLVTSFYQWLLADSFWYFLTVGIPKLAILAFYHRIFTIRIYIFMIYAIGAVVLSTEIVTSIISLNLCRPFEYNWDHTIPGGSCYQQTVFYEWASLPNILTDVAMLILPIPIVWKLHTSKNMKIGLTLTFLLASIGLAASIVRFDSFFHGDAIADGTWTVQLPIWTMVEPNLYLIAACLVTYHPLLNRLRALNDRVRQSFSSRGGRSYGTGDPGSVSRGTGQTSSKRVFPTRRKMGKNDLESLGNTFDMRDTVDIKDHESQEMGDDIRLVPLTDTIPRSGRVTTRGPTETSPNQIQVRNDFYVRTE